MDALIFVTCSAAESYGAGAESVRVNEVVALLCDLEAEKKVKSRRMLMATVKKVMCTTYR